jgi:DNA-binding NarL/FixJ family response regulator
MIPDHYLSPAEAGTLRFFLIDDQAASLQSLSICAQNMGATKITRASGYPDAMRRLRERSFDVILSDYLLGDGRSGQQLLEELRRFGLLPDETVFIMVTAEQAYEQVLSAVELVPDDYILKPFSGEQLRVRIERAILKKRFFAGVYQLRREKNFDTAVDRLAALAGEKSIYGVDILRLKAETYLESGRPELARAAYEEIMRGFEYPWAQVGIAQSFRVQERYEEAKALLDEVAKNSPDYLAAQDMQAQIALDLGDPEGAAQILEKLSARTPRNFVRKRQLAFAALANGQAEQALQVMSDVLANDSVPGAVTEEDRQQAARAAIAADKPEEAEKALGGFDPGLLEELPPDDRIARITAGLRIGSSGAEEYFREHRDWVRNCAFKPLTTMDVVAAALQLVDKELALAHTERLLQTGDMRQIFKAMHRMYVEAGLENEFRALQRRVALARAAAVKAADPGVTLLN